MDPTYMGMLKALEVTCFQRTKAQSLLRKVELGSVDRSDVMLSREGDADPTPQALLPAVPGTLKGCLPAAGCGIYLRAGSHCVAQVASNSWFSYL